MLHDALEQVEHCLAEPRFRGKSLYLAGDFNVWLPTNLESVTGPLALGRPRGEEAQQRIDRITVLLCRYSLCAANNFPNVVGYDASRPRQSYCTWYHGGDPGRRAGKQLGYIVVPITDTFSSDVRRNFIMQTDHLAVCSNVRSPALRPHRSGFKENRKGRAPAEEKYQHNCKSRVLSELAEARSQGAPAGLVLARDKVGDLPRLSGRFADFGKPNRYWRHHVGPGWRLLSPK